MRVAANGSDTLNPEVKRLYREACRLEEGHDEAAEAAVDVQTDIALLGQFSKCNNIVLAAVWEVNGGTYKLCGVITKITPRVGERLP